MGPWIKKKPKSHLGILKEEKDQKWIHSFQVSLRDWEKERAKRSFHFPEKRIAARGRNFQGKAWHRNRGKEGSIKYITYRPYRTDLARVSRQQQVWAHGIRGKRSAFNFWVAVQAVRAVQFVQQTWHGFLWPYSRNKCRPYSVLTSEKWVWGLACVLGDLSVNSLIRKARKS